MGDYKDWEYKDLYNKMKKIDSRFNKRGRFPEPGMYSTNDDRIEPARREIIRLLEITDSVESKKTIKELEKKIDSAFKQKGGK